MASKKSGGTQYIDLIPSPGIRRGFLMEKTMSRLHGVETIELDNGTVAIRTVRTAVIGLVGTAPDAAAGTAAIGRTGSQLTDNELIFSAKSAGVNGNTISVIAVAGVPGDSGGAATGASESAQWTEENRTLTITLGCNATGELVSTAKTVTDTINGLAGCPVTAKGTLTGIAFIVIPTLLTVKPSRLIRPDSQTER